MTYSVMEYVTGQTLGAAIRAGAPFTSARAIQIAAQIARALGAAHDKGIVHRDLKPENVFLVDRDGRTDFVKIVDFGIAKVTPIEGSAEPERAAAHACRLGVRHARVHGARAGGRRGDTDGRVDIYALGVILYEMIAGRVPHRGDSMVRTLAMQMLDPVEPPSKVRPDLDIPPSSRHVVHDGAREEARAALPDDGRAARRDSKVCRRRSASSVTGNPVYALAPLPPGADPTLDPQAPIPPTPGSKAAYQHPISVVQSPSSSASPSSSPSPPSPPSSRPAGYQPHPSRPPMRPKSPTSRLKHEPEFTTSDRPKTFEHVFAEDDDEPVGRRWPLILLFALILGGAAAALLLVWKSRSTVIETPRDAAVAIPSELDAGVVIPVPPVDAEELVSTPRDASIVLPPLRDGGRIALKPLPDANTGLVIDPTRHDPSPGRDEARSGAPLSRHDVPR